MPKDFFQGLLWLCIGLMVIVLSSKDETGPITDPGQGTLSFGPGMLFCDPLIDPCFSFMGRLKEVEK